MSDLLTGDHFHQLAQEIRGPWPNTLRSLHLEYLCSDANDAPLPGQRELAGMWGINAKTLRSWLKVRGLPTDPQELVLTRAGTTQPPHLSRLDSPTFAAEAPTPNLAPVLYAPVARAPVPRPTHLFPRRNVPAVKLPSDPRHH